MPQWLTNSITTVSDSDAQRVLRLRIWYHSTQGVSDSSNSFSVSGSWPSRSGSVSISVPGSGGQGASQLIYDEQITVSKQYGSTVSRSFNASLSGIDYWGAGQTITTSGSATVPARPYVRPNAPGAPSVTRNSDTSHSLSWSRNPTTAGPYTSQRVRRRVYAAGSWGNFATRANVSGTATAYTDDATRADRVFQYAIQAVNSAGHTSSEFSVFAFTTPATPSSVVATKLTSGDIRVRITPVQATPAVNFQIQHSTNDGSSWSALATVSGSREVTDYIHVSPNPAQTHRYRVRVVVNASGHIGHGLASDWRTSANIQLAAPPNAPTGLGPSTPHDATEPRTLHWTHNPVDASDQEAFQVYYRVNGGPWSTTGKITSDMSEWTAPADLFANGVAVEWEVQTWGQHENPSPRSGTASFVTSARPTAAITAPEDGATLAVSTLAIVWEYFQAQDSPQAQWRASLFNGGSQPVESRQGSGGTATITFATPIEDDQAYTVRLEVASAIGLWSEPVEVTFDVAYPLPALIDTTLEWDRDSGTVALALEPQGWDGVTALEPVAATIERSVDDGESWEVIHRALPLGGGITSALDMLPPTRGETLYRVTSISALPSMDTAEPVAITIDEREYCYLSYGPQFENVLVFYGNLSLTSAAERAEVIENFAGRTGDRGRPAGVIISGETRTRSIGVAATLLLADGLATGDDFEDAAHHGGLMCLRGPSGTSGRRVFGMMHGLSTSSQFAPLEGIQFTISETGRG